MRKYQEYDRPGAMGEQLVKTHRSRRRLRVLGVVLLLGLIGLLAVGPGPREPGAGMWETLAWRVEHLYGGVERAAGDAAWRISEAWRRHVVQSQWGMGVMLGVAAVLLLVALCLFSRRAGR